MSESDTRCDTAAPSDEAVEAHIKDAHIAFTKVDVMRIRAEERAATLREVEELREALLEIARLPHSGADDSTIVARERARIARAALAHFNPEAE